MLFNFKVIGNNVKIIYNGNVKINVAITIHLRNLKSEVHTIKHRFEGKNTWFIPDFDYSGCNILSIYDLDNKQEILEWVIPITLSVKIKKQNIICVGLNKTGTSTLMYSLIEKGYKFFEVIPAIQSICPDIYHGDYNSLYSILENERFDAYKDLPFSLPDVYKKVHERRPNDIYILTVRENEDKWVKSFMRYFSLHLSNSKDSTHNTSTIHHYTICNTFEKTLINWMAPLLSKMKIYNTENLEEKLIKIYRDYNASVIDYFKDNKNFMVIDVSKNGEHKKLMNWLNIETKKNNFDHIIPK